MAIVNMHEAKSNLSKLIARAEAGEEILIARDGKPIVRLDVVRSDIMAERRRQAHGKWRGKLGHTPDSVWFEPAPDEELGLGNPRDAELFSKPKR